MNHPTHYLDTTTKRIAYIQYLRTINLYTGAKMAQFVKLFNRLQTLKMAEQRKLQAYSKTEIATTLFYQ